MSKGNPTYYKYKSLDGQSFSLIRFFEEGQKAPEIYRPKSGWEENMDLYTKKISGEIDDSDIISEEVANKVMGDIDK
jgi:hypothetical protein